MEKQKQRQLVLVGAIGLTALLLGSVVGGLLAYRTSWGQMHDPEFLRQQLKQIDPADGKPANGPPPALVRVSQAQWKTVEPQKPIIGRLVEVRKVTVASEVTGKIVEMPVEEGTAVVGGKTVLARIDDVWSRLAVQRCRAQIASTEAKLRYELNQLRRYQTLSQKNVATESELESREAAVSDLQAQLAETKAALEEASERQLRSVIVAPFDGTVVTKSAELGGHVLPNTPLVDVVSRGEVDALIMVPESVINRIEVGQTLPIQLDPLGEEIPGTVVSITPYGPTASRTFPVRVRLDDQQGRLKVGMSVTAIIATGPQHEALVVSRDAVLVRPDGSTVWIATLNPKDRSTEVFPVPVTIKTRMRDEYAVAPETAKGRKLLTPGAQVVVEGAERLMAGQAVRILTDAETLTEMVPAQVGPPQNDGSLRSTTAPSATSPSTTANTADRKEG